MSDCAEMDEPSKPHLRLLPGQRNELEINTAIVRRFMAYAPGELVELTALADGGPFVAQVTTEDEHVRVLRDVTNLRGFAGVYMLVSTARPIPG